MLARIAAALGSVLDRLSPRERVLLGLLGLVAVGMVCILVVLLSSRSLSRIERQVEEQAQALRDLRAKAPELRSRLEALEGASKQAAVEIPALGTQLEAHASKAGLGDAALEMVDQPEEIVGDFVRKSVQVRLRKQPLGKLADFWARTVNDRARYPIAITRLNVRRRRHEADAYDVEMIVSSYSPSTEPAPTKNGSRSRGTKGATKAKSSRSTSRQ
jgi:type II secretory pathway component PulM